MGGARRASRARGAWIGALLATPALWACAAGPLIETDGGFRHARYGYQLGLPPASSPSWKRIEVAHSLLAYERKGPARMTLSARCGGPLTGVEILARHLRIGLPEHTVRESAPVTAEGLAGWEQVFDVLDEGVTVRVKTVTFVVRTCALDWVLSVRAGAGFEDAERDFDAWWQTLRVPADDRGGAS